MVALGLQDARPFFTLDSHQNYEVDPLLCVHLRGKKNPETQRV